MSGARFHGSGAVDYDARIRQRIPGYALLHSLTAATLRARLPADARILAVGAGTGQELIDMAAGAPGWHYTALDPAEDMLMLARQRCGDAGIAARIDWHVGTAETVTQAHDAAVALLVLHFLADDTAKLALLSELRRCLAPGGWLALADLQAPDDVWERAALEEACRSLGMKDDALEAMRTALARDFHPLSAAQRDALLERAGFTAGHVYFRVPGYAAVIARCD